MPLNSNIELKVIVWMKGHAIPNHDPNVWRADDFNHIIRYSDYGDRSSEYGWEIDHIVATALGGGDNSGNLRPLHHRINSGLGGLLGSFISKS
jgi:hypothetical protein